MTVLRFKHATPDDPAAMVSPYPETQRWIDKNIPFHATFELETIEDRTIDEHRWFFAVVKKVFENLPEDHEFLSAEHLRKHALIEAGWCDSMDFPSRAAADMARTVAEWCGQYLHIRYITSDRGTKDFESRFRAYRAKSMRFKKNGGELTKEKYREVVERALVWMSGLIGVDAAELLREVPEEFR